MKKIIASSSLVATALVILGNQAFAADSDTKNQKASVSLTQSTDPNTPLLEITSASDLDFGSQAIGINNMNFVDNNNPSIVITDIRGNAPGWNVAVSLGEFNATTGSQTLKGVQLFYPTVFMTTTQSAITVNERRPQTIATDSSLTNASLKGVLIEASSTQGPKTLINATSGKGNGQWTATYSSGSQVELYVPSGNLAGSYQADLTYTLTDGPVS